MPFLARQGIFVRWGSEAYTTNYYDGEVVQELELPPEPQLFESMRAVGYTTETAVADLVDNALAAHAKQINVLFGATPEPYVALLDDGDGMDMPTAQQAMQLAGTGGRQERSFDDLGRFGLGLKTASMSQCRRLTLITRGRGQAIVALRWDLDLLKRTGRWTLLQLAEDELAALPRIEEFRALDHGTMILWENLDQLLLSRGARSEDLDRVMADVRDHLGLVFHRFLQRVGKARVNLTVNHSPVPPADPFLSKHRLTQASPEETIDAGGTLIKVQAFTLPHLSKLSKQDLQRAQLGQTLRDSQGFYVYRGERLVIWGTWFRTQRRSETAKLARVRVDIPNTLDHMWALDVKKSSALPPPEVLQRLKSLAVQFSEPSKRTTLFRGRGEKDPNEFVRLWQFVEDRDAFFYRINHDHPLVQQLLNVERGHTVALLSSLELSLPLQDSYLRLSQDQNLSHPSAAAALGEVAAELWRAVRTTIDREHFVKQFQFIEPFLGNRDAAAILEEATREE